MIFKAWKRVILALLPVFFYLVGVVASGVCADAVITVSEPSFYTESGYFPDIGCTLTRGYAPYPVFFEGWESTPRTDIISYQWDFGTGTESDEGGRYFSGLNAAHIFETPGIYTVRLRVQDMDGNWSAYDTATIEVLSRDSGTTFYVDSAVGDDSYTGTSRTVNGANGPWKTATKAFSMMKRDAVHDPVGEWPYQPGDRILFRRGQTFELSESINFGHGEATQGYYFGPYGATTDAKPMIQWTGNETDFFLHYGYGAGYIGFVDLQFNFLGQDSQATGLIWATVATKNILYLRCDFFEPENSVFMHHGYDPAIEPTGIFMVGCSIRQPLTAQTAVTQMYGGPRALALISNTFDESGNHIAYLTSVNRAVISGNIFSRPARGRTALRITGGDFSDPGNNIYIADNMFIGWNDPLEGGSGRAGGAHGNIGSGYNYLLVELGPNGESELMLKDIVFERNTIINARQGLLVANADDVIVRNNIFVTPDSGSSKFVHIGGFRFLSRPSRNISVVNNTFISNPETLPATSRKTFIAVDGYDGPDTVFGNGHQGIRISNNIFYTLDGRGGLAVELPGLDQALLDEIECDNNVIFITGAQDNKFFGVGSEVYTIGEWRAVTGGMDSNSIVVDPLFAGPIGSISHDLDEPGSVAAGVAEVNGYKEAVKVEKTGPAIDAGAFVPVYFDFDEKHRPYGSGLDGGVFE